MNKFHLPNPDAYNNMFSQLKFHRFIEFGIEYTAQKDSKYFLIIANIVLLEVFSDELDKDKLITVYEFNSMDELDKFHNSRIKVEQIKNK